MFFNTQRLGVAPHLVELADQLDGLFGGLALAGNVQVDELVPSGGQAAHFDNAVGEARFVVAVIATDQFALPLAEEIPGMLAATPGLEVVDHRLQVDVGRSGMGP